MSNVPEEPNGDSIEKQKAYARFHAWVALQHPSVRIAYKAGVALAGIAVIAIGLVLVPLPGPGWLVVFLGLAILGLEFPAAKRVNNWVKAKLAQFWAWWKTRRATKKN